MKAIETRWGIWDNPACSICHRKIKFEDRFFDKKYNKYVHMACVGLSKQYIQKAKEVDAFLEGLNRIYS